MPHLLEGLITRDEIANISAFENLIFDDEERISVLEARHSIDVQACPGSGKTTLIAAKLILLARNWKYSDKGVCVLSHTNVAKDEIIGRLKNSSVIEARRLLSYPHFIGTIQEFVNRFLANPLIRSTGVQEITIDNDRYVEAANKLLARGQFGWLRGTLNGLGDSHAVDGFLRQTYRYLSDSGELINLSLIPRAWRQPDSRECAEKALWQLKKYLEGAGFFLFRDMYTHAQKALSQNPELSKILVNRYPCVFLDEMQDTQHFQDELLNSIFPQDDEASIIQRFGDPDQAIFHGYGKEKANESFNNKSLSEMDNIIYRSHRFDNSLAEKTKLFSFNQIPLESECSAETLSERSNAHVSNGVFEHTVIIFTGESCGRIAESFAQIVSNQFDEQYKQSSKFTAKMIGAVGNEIDPSKNQLKIGHYWSGYDKAKSKASFKEASLIEAVRYCRQSQSADWLESYKLLVSCVLKFLRMKGKVDDNKRYFSSITLKDMLKNTGCWEDFRKIIYSMISDIHELSPQYWSEICVRLSNLFDLDQENSAQAIKYFSYSDVVIESSTYSITEATGEGSVLTALPGNRMKHSDGFHIDFSTIHGVKGETHDATLILETKNHTFDLETMLPYLLCSLPSKDYPNQKLPDKPNSRRKFSPNKVFMRQLYVAMSRPRHLLCFALHSDRLPEESRNLLSETGWKIEVL